MNKIQISLTAFLLIIVFCFYQIFWGRLFPWSPFKLGYRQLQISKATIILPNHLLLPEKLQSIDNLFTKVEQFHQLQFNKHVMIIIPKTNNEFTRFTGQKIAVACSLQTGTVIYLSPRIIGDKREMAVLKHELAHTLLYQHTSFFKSYKIPRWLNEGVAIYSGNPHDYYEGEDFTKFAVDRGYFFDVLNPTQAVIKKIPQEYRNKFIYAEYRSFIAFMVKKYGVGKLQNYLKSVIVRPKLEKELFKQIYQVELPEMALQFRKAVLNTE